MITTTFYCWPIGGVLLWFIFRRTASDTLEHASLEGASPIQRFFRLGIAGNRLAIFGVWLVMFSLCFGELSTTQMVLPPGMDTIPRLTLGLLHAGVDEMTAALTIVTVSGIIGISMAGLGMIRLNNSRHGQK